MLTYESYCDDQLVSLLKQGDEQAFAQLYDRYWEKLYAIAHKRLQSIEQSEELVQEIFCDIWEKRATREIANFPAYIAKAVQYQVFHILSKKYKAKIVDIEQVEESVKTNSTEEAIMNRFLLNEVAVAAKALPEKCRLVFIRNKVLDQPLQDVANHLNISLKTAEAHLTKALHRIRDRFPEPVDTVL